MTTLPKAKAFMRYWLKHLFPDKTFRITASTYRGFRQNVVYVKVHGWEAHSNANLLEAWALEEGFRFDTDWPVDIYSSEPRPEVTAARRGYRTSTEGPRPGYCP